MYITDTSGAQDHEEPVELDEVQEKCYNEQNISLFLQTLAHHHTDEDGWLYIVKTFEKSRKAFNHIYCAQRRQKDWEFLQAVRQRTSLNRGSTFSIPSWETQPAGISPSNSYKADGVSPRIWSSAMNSVPDMTDTSSTTGVSPNDGRDSGHALTPASSWQLAAAMSDLPGTATFPPRILSSSNESSYCLQQDREIEDAETHPLQEPTSIQGCQLNSSCQQDSSTLGLCPHQIHTGTYCGKCADEVSLFFGPEDFETCSMGHVVGEDGGHTESRPKYLDVDDARQSMHNE